MACLVTLPHLDLGEARRDRITNVSSLAGKAYHGLAKLCFPLHGESPRGVSVLLKGLLTGILMVVEGPTRPRSWGS